MATWTGQFNGGPIDGQTLKLTTNALATEVFTLTRNSGGATVHTYTYVRDIVSAGDAAQGLPNLPHDYQFAPGLTT